MKKTFVSMVVFVLIVAITPINTYAISSSDFSFRKVIGAPETSYNTMYSILVNDTDRVTLHLSQITSGAKLFVSYSNSNKPIILDSIGTYYIVLPPYSNTITVNIRAVFDAPSGYIAGSVF